MKASYLVVLKRQNTVPSLQGLITLLWTGLTFNMRPMSAQNEWHSPAVQIGYLSRELDGILLVRRDVSNFSNGKMGQWDSPLMWTRTGQDVGRDVNPPLVV